jgi:hypothetical protein
MATPNEPANGAAAPLWLSVAAAAARAGVSKRAMQKRASAGKIGARKIGIGAAARWEIDARELDDNQAPRQDANQGANREPTDANREPAGREPFAPLGAVERESELRTANREPGANQGANREPARRELSPDREAELKSEIAFLRGIVESDRRDMAEIRAALREALKLAPKQLTAGALDGKAKIGAASGVDVGGVAASNGATSAPDREPFDGSTAATAEQSGAAALTYGDILRNLEARGF